MVGGRVVVFSACALGLFVYALLTLAEPGAMDQEADADTPRWGLVARGGAAMAMALIFTIVAITQIDV